jgi:hypothetical protein
MLLVFVALFELAAVLAKLRVGLLTSDDVEVSSQSSYSFELLTLKSHSFEVEIDELQLDLVYDLSFSAFKSHAVSVLAKTKGFVHIVEWSEQFAAKVSALYPHLGREDQLDAGVATLKALSIKEIVVLTDDFEASNRFKQNFELVAAVVVVEGTPQASLDKIAMRNFKNEGVRTLVVDLSGDLTDKAFLSFDRARMMKEGYVIICSPHTSWHDPKSKYQGPLMLLEEGTETASSLLDSKLLSLDWAVQRVTKEKDCSISMKACLAEAFAARKLKLVNLLGGSRTEVGEVAHGDVVLTKAILYPGNQLTFDPTKPVEIKITTISSSKTQYGDDPGNPDDFKGFFVALEEATEILGRFYLTSREIECGASGYEPEFAWACVEHEQHDLGIAIFASWSSGAALGVLEAMKGLNLTQPLIGSHTTASLLSSKAAWPNFMRTIQKSSSTVPGLVQFMLKYGFTQTNLFFSDEIYGKDFAEAALIGLSASSIEVVTPESNRVLTDDFVANTANYKHVGQFVIESGIRPMIILALTDYRIALLDMLYELGLRMDDVVILNDSQDSTLWKDGSPPEVVAERLTLVVDTFNFEQSAFAGPLGSSSRDLIRESIGQPPYPGQCQYFDSCYLLVYALQTMIIKGRDFEDTAALNFQLRDTSFYGCTGRVSIDKDSNDRRDQDVDVFNIKEVTYGEYLGIQVWRVSMTSSQVFTHFEDPVWPGGKTTAPALYRLNYKDCPFPEEYRHDFKKGKDLVLYLCLGYVGFTGLIAVLVLLTRKLKNSVEMMTDKVQVTFQDRVVLLLVLVDFLQYIGHGPVLDDKQDVLQKFIDYASAGTLDTINFNREGVYKLVLNSILGLVLLWFIFSLLTWMKFRGVRCCELLTSLGVAAMPLLGNALFLPITSVLFDIFICEEAQGVDKDDLDYSDSFMFRDCHEDCWGGTHRRYVIAVSIALVLYHPITIITRPLWQELVPDMHLKTRQTFYLQKSLVEVILVGIRRGLRSRSRLAHGVVYIAVIFIHLVLCFIRKPFNYQRLNLWFSFSMFMVIIVGITSLLENSVTGFAGPDALALMFGVGGFILVLGVLLQLMLFPSLLAEKKYPYLKELFRFGFDLRNIKPPECLQCHRLNYLVREEEEEPKCFVLDLASRSRVTDKFLPRPG